MSPRLPEPLFDYFPGEGPMVISFPHSGTDVPPELAARLTPEARDLPDTDWFVPQLYDCLRGAGTFRRASSGPQCGDRRRPQLLAARLDRIVHALSAQQQFSVIIDGRFKSGYITRHYGIPAARIPAFDADRARPLNQLLRKLLQSVAGRVPSTRIQT